MKDNRQARRRPRPVDPLEPRQLDAEHFLVQEKERALRLVLGRRRDPASDCEVGQKYFDLVRSHIDWVPLAVEPDEAFNPVDIDLLGPDAVVFKANLVSYAGKESGRIGGGHRNVLGSRFRPRF